MKISIIGSGTWGSALSKVFSDQGFNTYLFSFISEEVKELNNTHIHKNLKNMVIPSNIVITDNLKETIIDADYIIMATPSIYIRSSIEKCKEYINDNQVIINVAKGIEDNTLFTMSDIISEVLPNNTVVTLSGPTHAEEVALGMTTTIVSASKNIKVAKDAVDLFRGSCIRAYTNEDVLGVEICGALKNVIALAAGISSGLGNGDNAKAAIITRGIVEIIRLGKAMGAKEKTFNGLAGIGDLIVTATSIHSRNNKCGYLIGEGYSKEDAIKEVGMVVEGINSLNAAIRLQEKYNVSLPIISGVNAIINQNKDPRIILEELMNRPSKDEIE